MGRISESIKLVDELQGLVDVSHCKYIHRNLLTITSPIMVPISRDFFTMRGVLSSTAAQQLIRHPSSSTHRHLSLLLREVLFEKNFRIISAG
jgi:hypothetical protein